MVTIIAQGARYRLQNTRPPQGVPFVPSSVVSVSLLRPEVIREGSQAQVPSHVAQRKGIEVIADTLGLDVGAFSPGLLAMSPARWRWLPSRIPQTLDVPPPYAITYYIFRSTPLISMFSTRLRDLLVI